MIIWFDKAAIVKSATRQTDIDRIEKLNAIIDTLLDAQLEFGADPNKLEYGFDDGQTKIKMVYRDLAAVAAAIAVYDRTLQMYLNRVNGRMSRLMDSKNFPNMLGLNC